MIQQTSQMALWETPIQLEIENFASLPADERGAIYTKPEVVEFMLDQAGFSSKKKLYKKKILEPACGNGEFLIPIASRLFESYCNSNQTEDDFLCLKQSVLAIELSKDSLNMCAERLDILCLEFGFNLSQTREIVKSWLHNAEFLSFDNINSEFDFVFGNPPYIRYDKLPPEIKKFCKFNFKTFSDRGDLYIPFFEKSLSHLKKAGDIVLFVQIAG